MINVLGFESFEQLEFFAESFDLLESFEGGSGITGLVVGTQNFADNIGNTGSFDHGTDGRTGDKASTFGSRAEEDLCGSVLGVRLVRNSAIDQGNLNEVAVTKADGFFDSVGDVWGFG